VFQVGEAREGQATMETAGARNDLRPSVMRTETSKQARDVKLNLKSKNNATNVSAHPDYGVFPFSLARLAAQNPYSYARTLGMDTRAPTFLAQGYALRISVAV